VFEEQLQRAHFFSSDRCQFVLPGSLRPQLRRAAGFSAKPVFSETCKINGSIARLGCSGSPALGHCPPEGTSGRQHQTGSPGDKLRDPLRCGRLRTTLDQEQMTLLFGNEFFAKCHGETSLETVLCRVLPSHGSGRIETITVSTALLPWAAGSSAKSDIEALYKK
jgi:hypothetical protein